MSFDETKAVGNAAHREPVLIVGVGASAGGVEALSRLLAAMPGDMGIALVVVTHIGPHREALLAEILGRQTRTPVVNVEDGMALVADHIYVLATDAVVTLEADRFRLQPARTGFRERNPIDLFFTSLAQNTGDRAVGIILSGAGSDGTLGLKMLKERGGLTIAQGYNHGSAPAHDGMPASAIASGLVDLVLPVEEIGAKLLEYRRSYVAMNGADGTVTLDRHAEIGSVMKEIFGVLRKRVGHDFERYKERTFLRRVQRRMQLLQLEDLQAYAERLRNDRDEAGLLFRDLLIGVTSFFRDADAFAALATIVIPKLFANAGAASTVRVWVPACATGEEAYSIAILLREHMDTLPVPPAVQVFATDIDEGALAVARSGRYPAQSLDDVAPERLKRFFRTEPASYVLTKEVRDLCIFSAHSVIRDPPFSRIDLVSCRNLLIYFNSGLQDNVLPLFHYALKPGGFLFLGPSENLTRSSELFGVIDKKHRIFQRRATINAGLKVPLWMPGGERVSYPDAGTQPLLRKDQRFRQQVDARVMDTFAPAHIVVDSAGDIVYYSARTGKYLEPQMGSPSRQILSMARKGLRLELRSALLEVAEKRHTITRERVEVALEDRVQFIRLIIEPFGESDQDPFYLVVFVDIGPPLTPEEAAHHRPAGKLSDVSSLEQELRETRDRLQATIEEYETALEELKSGNEELVSVNEELQSTNEELETSKEELQSVNEELQTVNQELAIKVDELHRSNADLRNLFESTQIATVFLDRHMLIRSYTPAVTAIFNLIPGDRGRPITDIAHQLEDVDLRADIWHVLNSRAAVERPVRMRHGKVFHLMRILPYRITNDEVDGALITFMDVTPMVAAEEQQRLLVAELNHRVRNMLQVVIGLANQTLHRSTALEDFEKVFMGRMQALARAYELLSKDGWRKVSMAELVHSQMTPFATEGHRYSTDGDPLVLTASGALSLGLVLYELATNATKYGALSVPTGKVRIDWRTEKADGGADVFTMIWGESGGPAVRQPSRHGFGSELMQKQLHYELAGRATLDFAPAGLQVTLVIPAENVVTVDPAEAQNG